MNLPAVDFPVIDLPIIKGAMLMMVSQGDIRKELSLVLLVAVLILAIMEGFGLNGGPMGQALIGALTLMLGYWFGRKEKEQETAPPPQKTVPAT